MPDLYFLKNIESGETIELVKSPFTIGRMLSSDFVIANTVISKSQCILEKTDDGWILTDTSTNGTMVNKDVIKKKTVALKNLDEICFGFHTFTYQFFTSPSQSKCYQIEKLKSQEKGAILSLPNSPNSFDEHGVSDEVLNALTDKMLDNIRVENVLPLEETNNPNLFLNTKVAIECHNTTTNSHNHKTFIKSLNERSESVIPHVEDLPVDCLSAPKAETKSRDAPSQSLNLSKILNPVELLMRSVSSNAHIRTLEVEPPDNTDSDTMQRSNEAVKYPLEVLPDETALSTNSLRSEISNALNLIADKTPDIVVALANSSSIRENSKLNVCLAPTVSGSIASCSNRQNLVNISNKYASDVNTIVPQSSEVSATNLLIKIANGCKTPSDTLFNTTTITRNPKPGSSVENIKQLNPIMTTTAITSPVNPSKKVKVLHLKLPKNMGNKVQSRRCGDAQTSLASNITTLSRPTSSSVRSESFPLLQEDVIDLTNTPEITNYDNVQMLGSNALPVAHNEVVTTSDTPTIENEQEPRSSKLDHKKDIINSKNSYEEMENELLCTICANLFIKTVTLGCAHSFCAYCIEEWKKKKSECPVCRTQISSTIRTLVLDNIIEKVIESASEDERAQRKEAVQERENIEKAQKEAQERAYTTARARRGRGRGVNNRNQNRNENNLRNNNNPRQQPVPVVEVSDQSSSSSNLSSTYDSDSDLSESDYNYDEYEDDAWYDDHDGYNGVQGAYYGGYGRCYRCGDRGHWANGCPNY